MKLPFLRKNRAAEAADALYGRAVDQARAAAFYAELGAPDTMEGRFELLSLHVYLVLRRLKYGGADAEAAAQGLCDALFQNLDDALREMGVGDLSVPRKIRKLAESFYGRVGAYEKALAPAAPDDALAAALARNVYADPESRGASALADYTRRAAAALDDQPLEDMLGGSLRFPEPTLHL